MDNTEKTKLLVEKGYTKSLSQARAIVFAGHFDKVIERDPKEFREKLDKGDQNVS